MRGSKFQGGDGVVPGAPQGFPSEQLAVALEASGKDNVYAMFHRELECQSYLGVDLAIQAVHMRFMMGKFYGAIKSQNLEVLVLTLEE